MPSPGTNEIDRNDARPSLRERLAIEVDRTYGKRSDAPAVKPTNLLARIVAGASSPVATIVLLLVGAVTGTTNVTYPILLAVTVVGLVLAILRKFEVVGDAFGPAGGWFPIVFGGLWLFLIVTIVFLPGLTPVAIVVLVVVLWLRLLHPLALLGNHMLHPDPDDPARL